MSSKSKWQTSIASDQYCSPADDGLSIFCIPCNKKVLCKSGYPFSNYLWVQHCNTKKHKEIMANIHRPKRKITAFLVTTTSNKKSTTPTAAPTTTMTSKFKATSSCVGSYKFYKDKKYALAAYAEYRNQSKPSNWIVKQGKNGNFNIFSTHCKENGSVIEKVCSFCVELRAKDPNKFSSIAQRVLSSGKLLFDAKRALENSHLDHANFESIKKVCKIGTCYLSERGVSLRAKVKSHKDYLDAAFKCLPVVKKEYLAHDSSVSFNTAQSPDTFLTNFVDLYTNNTEFRDSLIVTMLNAMVTRITTQRLNAQHSEIMLNFCIAMHATSRVGFEFFSANFMGPCLRVSLLQNNYLTKYLLVNINIILIYRLFRGGMQ